MIRVVFLACTFGVLAAPLHAQHDSAPSVVRPRVVLCEAPWMDAERVRELIAVELAGNQLALVDVHGCTDIAADVRVRFANDEEGARREAHLDLSQTPPAARSRLVALITAELLRPGAPASVTPAGPVPDDASAELSTASPVEGAAGLEVEMENAGGPEGRVGDFDDDTFEEDGFEEDGFTEDDFDFGEDDFEETHTADDNQEERRPPPRPDRCEAWDTMGRGPCSWAITLSYGLTFQQLGFAGRSREALPFFHQLRLAGRWRYLVGGVRIFGMGARGLPRARVLEPETIDVVIGGLSGYLGAEWWTRRWSKYVLALRTALEIGFHGVRSRTTSDCFQCITSGKPYVGGFASLRFERAFGVLRGAVEVEFGVATGFGIELDGVFVTGLGGPSISINVDLSLGRAE